MSNPTDWMKNEYDELVKKGFDWKPPVVSGPSTGRAIIDGKERVMLCANNYLSMSNHPKVKQAAIDAYNSSEYQELSKLRWANSIDTNITIMDGGVTH